MMRVESTAGCMRTPEVLMALHELGLPHAVDRVPDGHFTQTYGRMGPRLVDGELAVFEPTAIVRHLLRRAAEHQAAPRGDVELCEADQWLDFVASQLRPAIGRYAQAKMAGRGDDPQAKAELGKVMSALQVLERQLQGRDFLLGRFTVVDCALSPLGMLALVGIELDGLPRLAAYRERLLGRPSWASAMA